MRIFIRIRVSVEAIVGNLAVGADGSCGLLVKDICGEELAAEIERIAIALYCKHIPTFTLTA